MADSIRRRDFLRRSALAAAGLSLPRLDLGTLERPAGGRRGRPQRVLVLGAGLAGLSAADELVRAGHDVVVLEARTYPGGRVHTIREPFADGLHAEAGAARIPDTHDLTLGYVRKFGLELEPFAPEAPWVVFAGGQRTVPRKGGPPPTPPGLTPEEQRLGIQGAIGKYIAGPLAELGDPTAPGWPPESLRRYDEVTFADWLRAQGASPALVAAADVGNGLNDTGSFLAGLREVAGELRETKPRTKIVGGNDRLPYAIARRLGGRVHYGAAVRRIEQDEHGVRVTVEKGGLRDVVSGDRAVCTIPFSVLRAVEASPAWPADKRRAIDELRYDPVSRVYLQTATRFWEREGTPGFAVSDHPMELFDASYRQPGPRGLLMTYARDALGHRLTGMSEDERVRWGVTEVEKIYPGTAAAFEGAVTKCWEEDPWARGAYLIPTRGQVFAFYRVSPRAEGRVHFAGEHTSPWIGWMQGALHSGLRAAREIDAAA